MSRSRSIQCYLIDYKISFSNTFQKRMFQFCFCFKTISQPNVQMSVKKQIEGVKTRQQNRRPQEKKTKRLQEKKLKVPPKVGPKYPKINKKPHFFSQLPRARPSLALSGTIAASTLAGPWIAGFRNGCESGLSLQSPRSEKHGSNLHVI